MQRRVDEYGFPIPEGFEDDSKPGRAVPRRLTLVVALVLMLMVAAGAVVMFGPKLLQQAARIAQKLEARQRTRAEHRQLAQRATLSFSRGEWGAAIPDLERLHERMPDDQRIRKLLATALNNHAYELALAEQDLPRALREVERSLQLAPPDAAHLDTRGYLFYLLSRHEEALRDMEKAVRLAESDLREASASDREQRRTSLEEILEHRALVYEKLGRADDARRDRERLKELRF